MKKSISIIVGVVIFISLIAIGNIIIIGDRLTALHSYVGYLYYLLVAGLFLLFIIKPLLSIALSKPISGGVNRNFEDMRPEELIAYMKSAKLSKEQKLEIEGSSDIATSLNRIKEQKSQEVNSIIKSSAKQNFIITAISQNGTYDILSSIAINFKMINGIVKEYGYRPSNLQLVKLYISVLSSSIIITAVDEILDQADFTEIIGSVGVPLLGVLSKSVLNGGMNGYICLRVGYTTVKYLELGASQFRADQHSVRSQVLKAARHEIVSVVGAGISQVNERLAKAVGLD